mmetsp:Transcript_34742/g.79676  ORF Transcript_34742/g.79676 Transcript_34742/m.79676 type:complete len:731 (+) Transcript_34742:27-2219(+)
MDGAVIPRSVTESQLPLLVAAQTEVARWPQPPRMGGEGEARASRGSMYVLPDRAAPGDFSAPATHRRQEVEKVRQSSLILLRRENAQLQDEAERLRRDSERWKSELRETLAVRQSGQSMLRRENAQLQEEGDRLRRDSDRLKTELQDMRSVLAAKEASSHATHNGYAASIAPWGRSDLRHSLAPEDRMVMKTEMVRQALANEAAVAERLFAESEEAIAAVRSFAESEAKNAEEARTEAAQWEARCRVLEESSSAETRPSRRALLAAHDKLWAQRVALAREVALCRRAARRSTGQITKEPGNGRCDSDNSEGEAALDVLQTSAIESLEELLSQSRAGEEAQEQCGELRAELQARDERLAESRAELAEVSSHGTWANGGSQRRPGITPADSGSATFSTCSNGPPGAAPVDPAPTREGREANPQPVQFRRHGVPGDGTSSPPIVKVASPKWWRRSRASLDRPKAESVETSLEDSEEVYSPLYFQQVSPSRREERYLNESDLNRVTDLERLVAVAQRDRHLLLQHWQQKDQAYKELDHEGQRETLPPPSLHTSDTPGTITPQLSVTPQQSVVSTGSCRSRTGPPEVTPEAMAMATSERRSSPGYPTAAQTVPAPPKAKPRAKSVALPVGNVRSVSKHRTSRTSAGGVHLTPVQPVVQWAGAEAWVLVDGTMARPTMPPQVLPGVAYEVPRLIQAADMMQNTTGSCPSIVTASFDVPTAGIPRWLDVGSRATAIR